jgi:hypothetical protein
VAFRVAAEAIAHNHQPVENQIPHRTYLRQGNAQQETRSGRGISCFIDDSESTEVKARVCGPDRDVRTHRDVQRAATTAAQMAKTVRPERSAATPCSEWDVAALLEHMAGGTSYLYGGL